MTKWIAVLVLAAALGGCKTKQPDKEAAVATLTAFIDAVEKNELDAAVAMLRLGADAPVDEVKKELPNGLASGELSKAGLAKLAADGTWGTFEQVFPDAADRVDLTAVDVPIGAAYALKLDRAEAGLYWDGSKFLIFRCDDLGTLVPPVAP